MNRAVNRAHSATNRALSNATGAKGGAALSIASWGILLLLAAFTIMLLIFLIQYLRTPCPAQGRKEFWTYLSDFDATASPCAEPEPEKEFEEREVRDEREVWNIKDQIYTFKEAQQKCKAYGSRLASKQEIVKAYNNGAQWSDYGWSQGREAYYPIQPCEYVKLRRQGLNIGPPGVNGGKFNSHLRFGANCFGIKPPGEVVNPKSSECPWPDVCQRNPDACKPLKSDHIAPFFPHKLWSTWGPEAPNAPPLYPKQNKAYNPNY
jgi:hypothetical protein